MNKFLVCFIILTAITYSAYIEEPAQLGKPERSYLGGLAALLLVAGFILLSFSWIIRKFKKEEKCIKRALLVKKIGIGLLILAVIVALIYVLMPLTANALGV